MQVFTKAVRFCVLSAVAAFGFFRKNALWVFLWLCTLALSIWLIRRMLQYRSQIRAWWERKMEKLRKASEQRAAAKHYRQREREQRQPEPIWQSAPEYPPDLKMQQAAVRHLNCRITDRIQSVFPDATWDWVGADVAQLALTGGTGRIRIKKAEAYNFADVSLNAAARLRLTLLQAVELEQIQPRMESKEAATQTEESNEGTVPAVDVEAWCDLVGRGPLYDLSSRLAEKGFKALSIDVDGTVYAVNGELQEPQLRLGEMPPKRFWKKLAALLTDDAHKAEVYGDLLLLKW